MFIYTCAYIFLKKQKSCGATRILYTVTLSLYILFYIYTFWEILSNTYIHKYIPAFKYSQQKYVYQDSLVYKSLKLETAHVSINDRLAK